MNEELESDNEVVECKLQDEDPVLKGPSVGEVVVKDYDVFPKCWKNENEKFSCRVCERPQKSFKALVLHEWKQHQGQIAFMCDICDQSFIQRRDRLHHRLKVHGSEKRKPITNKLRSRAGASNQEQSKTAQQETNGLYRCGICGRFQKSQSALKEHQERYHKGQKPFICDLCGKSFSRRQEKILHKFKEHNVFMVSRESNAQCEEKGTTEEGKSHGFTCEICKENFMEMDSLEKHYKASHVEEGPQSNQVEGLIEYPGMSRAGKFPLYNDIVNQMDEGKEFYWPPRAKKDFSLVIVCIWCKASFGRKLELEEHCIEKHAGFAVRCDVCDYKALRKERLALHRLRKHDLKTKGMGTFYCNLCAYKATIKSLLDKHMSERHRDEDQASLGKKEKAQPRVCEICGKEFSYKRSLDYHREVFHLTKKRIDCDICGAGLHSQKALAYHVWKQHEPHKPSPSQAVCEVCGKKCATPYILRQHMKSHQEMQFVCQHCGKGFCNIRSLRRHLMKHLKIYPFECKPCKKTYSQSQHLAYHICVTHMGLSVSEANKKENRALARTHEAYVSKPDIFKQPLEDMPISEELSSAGSTVKTDQEL